MAQVAWGAVGAVARGELRRRWRALLLLGLLAGAAAGLVAGTAAVAVRTGSAYARLLEATRPDDARLLVTEPRLLPGVLALPQVRSSWTGITVVGQRAGGGPLQYIGVSAGPPPPVGLFHPVVVQGRAAAAADEVVVSEQVASRIAGPMGVDLGDVLALDLLTPTEIRSFATGFGAPDGPRVSLRVVGVVRYPAWGEGLQNVLATPAFADRYAAFSPGPTALVRLAPGPAARAAFDAGVRAATADARLPRGDGGFAPIEAAYPPVPDPTVRASQAVLSGALGLLAGVAGVAGVLLLLQGFARHHAARAGDQRVEAALGLTRAERTLARSLPALLPAALAAAVAAAATAAAGLLDPLGSMARYEPAPGFRLAPGIAAAAAGLAALAVLLVAAGTAAVTVGRTARAASLPGAGAGRLPAGPAWATAGAALALRGGRGALGVRGTAVGAALTVAALVAALTVAAGLDRAVGRPERWGWAADFALVDAKEPDVARIAADPRVRDVDVVAGGSVQVGGRAARGYAVERRKGALPWEVLEGRVPATGDGTGDAGADEVALGPRLARSLGVGVGDDVVARDPNGLDRTLHVVGVVLVPGFDGGRLGDTLLLGRKPLADLAAAEPQLTALVRGVDRAAGTAVGEELAGELELVPATAPAEVTNLADVRHLPWILVAALAVSGGAALAHGLLTTVRRRRRDLAVLSVLGLRPLQVAAAVLVAAVTTAGLAVAVGLPLGAAAGRLLWAELAAASSLAGDPAWPWRWLGLTVAGALALAGLLAAVPAVRAARLRPAEALRAE